MPTLDDIHAIAIETRQHVKDTDRRLSRIEANTDLIRNDQVDNNKRVAVLEDRCAKRGAQLSGLVKKVSENEATGKIQIMQIRQTWKTTTVIAVALVSLASLVLSAWKYL